MKQTIRLAIAVLVVSLIGACADTATNTCPSGGKTCVAPSR
jgi:hypothetical protein